MNALFVRPVRFVALAGVVVLLIVTNSSGHSPSASPLPRPAAHREGTEMLGRMPVAFVPNLGQWEHPALYVSKIRGGAVFLEQSGFLLSWSAGKDGDRSRGASVRLRLAGAGVAELVPEQRLPGKHTYILGNDPPRWRAAPLFCAVRYHGPWPGVDVVCHEQNGHFEYDVALASGADLAQVEFAVEGGSGLRIDGDGALVIDTAAGPLLQAR